MPGPKGLSDFMGDDERAELASWAMKGKAASVGQKPAGELAAPEQGEAEESLGDYRHRLRKLVADYFARHGDDEYTARHEQFMDFLDGVYELYRSRGMAVVNPEQYEANQAIAGSPLHSPPELHRDLPGNAIERYFASDGKLTVAELQSELE